jgi:integrase
MSDGLSLRQRRPRGSGGITRLARSKWLIRVEGERDAAGHRRRLSRVVIGDRDKALAELGVLTARVGSGHVEPPARLTVRDFLREQWLPAAEQRVRARTLEGYEAKVAIIEHGLGGCELRKLSAQRVDRFIGTLRAEGGPTGKLAERSILHVFRVLRAACRQAVKWGLLPRDPTDAARPPRPAAYEPPVLDLPTARKVLDAFRGHALEAVVELALGVGLRRSEILGLAWSDVDLDAGEVRIRRGLHAARGGLRFEEPKSDRSKRVVSLPSSAIEALRAHRKRQLEARVAAGAEWQDLDHVFATRIGTPLHPSDVGRAFRARLDELSLPSVALKQLRHTSATIALESGTDVAIVSRRLGHSRIAVTDQFYLRPGRDLDRRAADALEQALHGGTFGKR